MNEKIRAVVFEAIDEVFKPKNNGRLLSVLAHPDFEFKELSDSSLSFVEFCMRVEEGLNIEIEFIDFMEHPTLQKFLGWLEQQDVNL